MSEDQFAEFEELLSLSSIGAPLDPELEHAIGLTPRSELSLLLRASPVDSAALESWVERNPAEVWRLNALFDAIWGASEIVWVKPKRAYGSLLCPGCLSVAERALELRGHGPRTVLRCSVCRLRWRARHRIRRISMREKAEAGL